VLNERHLFALLTEFMCYYNHDRPHRTIELETPAPSPPISLGAVVSRPILGGLHHVYARAACPMHFCRPTLVEAISKPRRLWRRLPSPQRIGAVAAELIVVQT
jgi:hypothetical protein